MRALLLVLAFLANTASAQSLPPQIASHVRDGYFDPGDYAWLRGSLPGANAAEVAHWQAIKAYLDSCRANPPRDEAALAALGYHAPADYWSAYATDVCSEVMMAGWTAQDFKDWPSYSRALATALPVYHTYLFAVRQAASAAPNSLGELRDQLHVAVIPDQVLRMATVWGQGDAADAPALDPDSRRVLIALLWRAIRDQDHRNTAWLKTVVAQHGWPTISAVGKLAAGNAWLLVQHADDDPIFQLRMLKLMEPLLARREVDGRNYALLYDRVMLPLTGKQRYGSQFVCGETGWRPRPLEDEAGVEEWRKSVGLQPLAEYRKSLIAAYGEQCAH
ncbi:DUF6624 domain-containing protein [Sphingomonas sp. KR3-1]|uniref:DUF6624 domain-containing protein n=1 Tax=Sphingomonas sp. KR3-1 TaxID=3156611 RepID=UPI0032B457F8